MHICKSERSCSVFTPDQQSAILRQTPQQITHLTTESMTQRLASPASIYSFSVYLLQKYCQSQNLQNVHLKISFHKTDGRVPVLNENTEEHNGKYNKKKPRLLLSCKRGKFIF